MENALSAPAWLMLVTGIIYVHPEKGGRSLISARAKSFDALYLGRDVIGTKKVDTSSLQCETLLRRKVPLFGNCVQLQVKLEAALPRQTT